MNYKDHVVANRNTTERIKTAAGHTTIPLSGTERTLSSNAKESSPPPSIDHDIENTAHSSPSKDSECESSSCTICLNAYDDRAVLETCHHEFCFSCIMQWSTLSHTCPLCIRPFTSCMHEIQNDQQYTVYQFEPLSHARSPSRRPTASDTTVPHGIIRRLYGPPQFRRRARNRPPPADSADEQSVSDRQQAALENRRNVYRNGLFVRHMGANRISGFQQITPETFRIFPQRLDRLVPWIRRELQAITTLSPFLPDASGGHGGTRSADNSNPHEETDSSLEIIREYIIAVCKQYDLQTDQGQDLIRDFLHDHTEHFVHELMGFARSSFSMEAYDRSAQYSSPSSSSTAAVVSSGGGNNGRLNNSEDSIDREPRERTKRRRYESPKDYGHVRGGSDSVQDGDEKRRRNNHDRETQSYFYGEDRATTVESSSSSSRSSRHGVKREYPPQRHASSSTKEVDLREGRSTDPRGSSSSKAEKGLSSDMIPLITVTPKKTDLQAILRAKLKREQDLYASRNKYP